MIYLLLSVLCSLTLANVFKYVEQRNYDRFGLITVNYGIGILLAAATMAAEGQLGNTVRMTAAPDFLGLAILEGVLFVAGLFMLALATRHAGISVSVGVQRISVVIPFAASWLVFAEVPTTFQFAGLAIGGAAFFMIARRPRWPAPTVIEEGMPDLAGYRSGGTMRTVVILTLLFLVGGSVDFVFKVFNEQFAPVYGRATFLLIVFTVAFVLCSMILLWRSVRYQRWPGLTVLRWGFVIGMANYGAASFLLEAVRVLSGPLVFPANNISIVIGGGLIGVFLWREQLSTVNWLGLACAALALALMAM